MVVKTKGDLTPGQRQALDAMPELKDSVFPRVVETMPAVNYTDPARYETEMREIFRKRPVIVGPSALLAKPNSYFQQDVQGMPVLVTRGQDGKVSAFVNVCRHRGAKLCASQDPIEGSRIVCPYHAWTYRLDGSLFGLPRQETFPGVDKSQIRLTPLPALEAGGLIWVVLDPAGPNDFSTVQGEIENDLDALGLGGMTVFDKVTFPIQANWKLVMDTMLDSYHVTRLHKDSLARFFVDTQNIIDQIGPHIRAAAARGNFTRSSPIEDFEDARKVMVFAYTLFPNGIVVVSPEFVSFGVLRPLASGRSEVDYYMLINSPPADEKTRDRLRRSFQLMEQAFGREDYWAAELCDAGLRTGTLKEVTLGGMEVQIALFHNVVNKCLAEAEQS